MKTFHGFHAHGFPNLFHMGLTQTGLAPNFTYMLDGQATHIGYIVEQCIKREADTVETTPEAEAGWVETVYQPSFMSDYLSHCTPGYYNNEGNYGEGKGFFEGHYGEGAVQFYDMLADWRKKGGLDGLTVS